VKRPDKLKWRRVMSGDVLPVHASQRWACCDCGLVHTFRFFWEGRGENRRLSVKVLRNEKWTRLSRRRSKFKGDPAGVLRP
jgi:hypothetical protein